ncbi:hypothetical protein NOVO_03545 [Rickettsiales bacterium Ac37b]|nr:hypothetical protein NOVO_03545 [Rickettsiales bacterium Ac37b]
MKIEELPKWLQDRELNGYKHYLNHTSTQLTESEEISVVIKDEKCISNYLNFVGADAVAGYDKVMNLYHIPLNLNHIENSCKGEDVYNFFSIYYFNDKNDKINFLLYYQINKENPCSLLHIQDMTNTYKNHREGYEGTFWRITIENTKNSIDVYGTQELDLTTDHFIC